MVERLCVCTCVSTADKEALQSKLGPTDTPVLLSSDCHKKVDTLERLAKPIVNKPAPKPAAPKPATPSPEPPTVRRTHTHTHTHAERERERDAHTRTYALMTRMTSFAAPLSSGRSGLLSSLHIRVCVPTCYM